MIPSVTVAVTVSLTVELAVIKVTSFPLKFAISDGRLVSRSSSIASANSSWLTSNWLVSKVVSNPKN